MVTVYVTIAVTVPTTDDYNAATTILDDSDFIVRNLDINKGDDFDVSVEEYNETLPG